MKKSFNVDLTFNDMRIDRWIRNNLGNYPQGLIEKSLKSGKVKINSKKIKSSYKIKTGDTIDLFNFDFKETIVQKKIKFLPSEEVIK
jgi:23S rRNA pseudouridine955/2504/2580 synthase